MKGTLAAKGWGVGVGVICWTLSACASPSPAEITSAPTSPVTTATTTTKADKDLTLGERIRAIAARSRAERNGHAPTEPMVRLYDKLGNVLHEYLRRDTLLIERPSTLPAALSSRTLGSFIVDVRHSALMSGDSVITGTTTDTVTDTYSSTVATGTLTALVDYTTGVGIMNADADDSLLTGESDIYAATPRWVDLSDSLTSGVQFVPTIYGEDGIAEVDFTTDMILPISYADSLMGGSYLRMRPASFAPNRFGDGTSRRQAMISLLGEANCATSLINATFGSSRTQASCAHWLYKSAWSFLGAGIMGVAGAAVEAGTEGGGTPEALWIWRKGLQAAGAGAAAIGAYAACRKGIPGFDLRAWST